MFDLFRTKRAETIDGAGIGLSVLCLLHCLAFPAAAAAAPMLAPGLSEVFGASHAWHLGLFAVAAPVSLVGLIWGMRTVRAGWMILLAGLIGLGLMAMGTSHMFGSVMETGLTMTGVTIVALAHAYNWVARTRAGHVHVRDCGMCEDEAGQA